jgi:uncharacterized membrane protein
LLKRSILPETPPKTTGETLAFAALSGLRSMAAPALLARAIRRGDVLDPKWTPYEILGRLSPLLQVLMVGEMVGDKTPFIPSRTSAGPLLGRAASGALVAAALRASGGRGGKGSAALLGALSAVAAAFAGESLRAQGAQRLGVPDLALALLEDGIVLYAGTRLLRRPGSR